MTLRQEVGIYMVESLVIPVKSDWRFVPVEASYYCLTDYIEGLIDYTRANKIVMRVEQYFTGQPQTEAAYEIDLLQMNNEDAIALIMTEGYVCDTVTVSSDQSVALIATHDLTSISIAGEAAVKRITGKSVLQMQHEYAD